MHLRDDETLRLGYRELRVFDRHGAVALRVLNSRRPEREEFSGIDAYRPDARWRTPAVFTTTLGERITITKVDGQERETEAAGRLRFALDGVPQTLIVTRTALGVLGAVFADGTSGVEAYRFRLVRIDEPEDDGSVVVYFNRVYQPPCAFSDQFVCYLPPPGNRLASSVRAGERAVVRGG